MYTIMRFEDRNVVVTGGAKGIGKACCLRFAEEGAKVAVLDIAREEAQRVATECEGLSGRPALALYCDVTDPASVDAAFERVVAAWGGVDIMVASAGIYSGQPLADVHLDEWQKVIDVDLTGVFLCDKAAARYMMSKTPDRGTKIPAGGKDACGSIINISSMAGKTSWPASAQYSSAKSGVIGLTRSVAMELAPYGVNVNAVCPGNTLTDMVLGVAESIGARDGLTAQEWLERRAGDCPMKRLATVDEIAGVVAFLASPDAGYITGQAIEVDGGMVLT